MRRVSSFNVEFGKRMRQARKLAKVKNTYAAMRIGCDPVTHSRKENGSRSFSLEDVAILCPLYDVSVDSLITNTCDALREK